MLKNEKVCGVFNVGLFYCEIKAGKTIEILDNFLSV